MSFSSRKESARCKYTMEKQLLSFLKGVKVLVNFSCHILKCFLLWCLTFHFKTLLCVGECQLGAGFMAHRGFFHDTQWTMSTKTNMNYIVEVTLWSNQKSPPPFLYHQQKVQQCITLHFSKSLWRFIRLGFALEGAISFIMLTTLLLDVDFGILMGAELKGRF